MFVPRTPGTVLPNVSRAFAAPQITNNISIDARGADTAAAEQRFRRAAQLIAEASVKQALVASRELTLRSAS